MKKTKEHWKLRVAEQFVLDRERWSCFVELLERPLQETRGLEKLFARPSVFRPEAG